MKKLLMATAMLLASTALASAVAGGLLALAFTNPIIAAAIAVVLLGLVIWGLIKAKRVLKRFLNSEPVESPPL